MLSSLLPCCSRATASAWRQPAGVGLALAGARGALWRRPCWKAFCTHEPGPEGGQNSEAAGSDATSGELVGARVYRRTRAEHHRVFQWGIGNSFRMKRENRFMPVRKPHPQESVVRDDYYESDNPNIRWADLNECWEVYWYENSKLNARPFPVKKFGIERAKREAAAFYEELKEQGRLHKPRKLDAPESGIFYDERMQAWATFFWRDGRPHSRLYGASKYGYEGAKMLAIEKRKDPVNGLIPIPHIKELRRQRALLSSK